MYSYKAKETPEIVEKQNVLLQYIVNRIKNNKNFILIVNGETGSGKTYWSIYKALEIAKELGTSFTLKNNIAFTMIDLLRKMNKPDHNIPGTVFLFEEVGAIGSGGSARQWQSKVNQVLNSFMQTSRHRNQILILTCPYFSNLDSAARKLCHAQAQMSGINFSNQTSRARVKKIQVGTGQQEKIYMKYLRYKDDLTGGLKRVQFIDSKMLSDSLAEEYEGMKLEFTDNLNKKMMEMLVEKEGKPKNKYRMGAKYIENKDKIGLWISEGKNPLEIANFLGVDLRTGERYCRTYEMEQNDV